MGKQVREWPMQATIGKLGIAFATVLVLSACGGGEPETQSEVESHGHAHD